MILLQFLQFDIFYFVPPKFSIWIQNLKNARNRRGVFKKVYIWMSIFNVLTEEING